MTTQRTHWLVAGSDDRTISLRKLGTFGTSTATVLRAQVVSVEQSHFGGELHLHTTGGQVYDITLGFRRKWRDNAERAFKRYGVTLI